MTTMHVLSIPYNDDLLVATGQSPAELEQEMRFLRAVKLFEVRRPSGSGVFVKLVKPRKVCPSRMKRIIIAP